MIEATTYCDTKDPCPVFDGVLWHIFGSGGSSRNERWQILHAVSENLEGPYRELPPAVTVGLEGEAAVAPGVIYEGGLFRMFVQTDFRAERSDIVYLVSPDGDTFTKVNNAIESEVDGEFAVYDAHPAIIGGEKYIVYACTPASTLRRLGFFRPCPDIHLAKSLTGDWSGPWQRLGPILSHHELDHHNQHDHPEYEWGLEGPQLIEVESGRILLQATCFLPHGEFGTRQRVFFAYAHQPTGPYVSAGPVLDTDAGENGHAAGVLMDGVLALIYQARRSAREPWRYYLAMMDALRPTAPA